MIFIFSYIVPVGVAGVIRLWPHELSANMQTNEDVLFIALFIELGFGFASFFSM